jgi:pantoate--beta-alanine ligase
MHPPLISTIAGIRRHLAPVRQSGRAISLVPTMGALHAGHGALMDRARRESGYVVTSIFVNPIQFDHPGDYAAYTIDLARDRDFCIARGVDAIFAPSAAEMYPAPPLAFVEVAGVSEHLCGKFRPGHFRGVATVVLKLLNIIAPDRAYFGEKDAQQLAVIQRMVADLNLPVDIEPVPTVREPDGLALSSRNQRLTPDQRRIAPALFQALDEARRQVEAGWRSPAEIRQAALHCLRAEPQIRLEYLEIVDAGAMTPVEQISAPVRIAAAVWLGTTRLIDNVWCTPPAAPPALQ